MAVRLLDRAFLVVVGLLILFAVTGCELRKSLNSIHVVQPKCLTGNGLVYCLQPNRQYLLEVEVK